ncbi:MAG: VPLPA-CTERM sorting domain-containing protein [Pseudomonadales bacterium]
MKKLSLSTAVAATMSAGVDTHLQKWSDLMLKKPLITLALFLFSFSINAATLIDNGSYFTDSASDLDWLTLSNTFNRSYNDISSKFGAGEEFEGWRYATGLEFEQLLFGQGAHATAGGCSGFSAGGNFCGGYSAINSPIQNTLISLFGDTFQQGITGLNAAFFSIGILADVGPTSPFSPLTSHYLALIAGAYTGHSLPDGAEIYTHWDAAYDGSRYPEGGSFLVRSSTSTVPVPAAAWLFGSALIGLVGIKRRQ